MYSFETSPTVAGDHFGLLSLSISKARIPSENSLLFMHLLTIRNSYSIGVKESIPLKNINEITIFNPSAKSNVLPLLNCSNVSFRLVGDALLRICKKLV
jgi:hypothetical protein